MSKFHPNIRIEIEEYAKWLGMDMEEDADLMWIARDALKTPLPPHWKACKSLETGDVYYFNEQTKASTWDHPCDEYYKQLYVDEKRKRVTGGKTDWRKRRTTSSTPAALPSLTSLAPVGEPLGAKKAALPPVGGLTKKEPLSSALKPLGATSAATPVQSATSAAPTAATGTTTAPVVIPAATSTPAATPVAKKAEKSGAVEVRVQEMVKEEIVKQEVLQQLKQQQAEMTEQIAELKEQLENEKTEAAEARVRLSEKLKSEQTTATHLRQQLDERTKEVEIERTLVTQLQQQLTALESSKSTAAQSTDARIGELEDRVKTGEAQLAELRQQLAERTHDLEDERAVTLDLQEEIGALKAAQATVVPSTGSDSQVTELTEKLKAEQAAVSRLQKQLEERAKEIEAEKARALQLQGELRALEETQISAAQSTDARVSELAAKLKAEQSTVADLRKQLEQIKQDAEKENARAAQLLEEKATAAQAAEARATEVAAKLKAEQIQIAGLRHQLEQQTKATTAEHAEVLQLQAELRTARELQSGEMQSSDAQVAELSDMLKAEQAATARVRQQLDERTKEVETERARALRLQQELSSLDETQTAAAETADSRVSELTEKLSAEQAQVALLRHQLEVQSRDTQTQRERAAQFEQDALTADARQRTSAQSIAELTSKLHGEQRDVTELRRQMDDVYARAESDRQRVAEFAAKLQAEQAQTARVQEQLDTERREMAELKMQVSVLQSRMRQMEEQSERRVASLISENQSLRETVAAAQAHAAAVAQSAVAVAPLAASATEAARAAVQATGAPALATTEAKHKSRTAAPAPAPPRSSEDFSDQESDTTETPVSDVLDTEATQRSLEEQISREKRLVKQAEIELKKRKHEVKRTQAELLNARSDWQQDSMLAHSPEDERLLLDVRKLLDAQAEAVNADVATIKAGSKLLKLRNDRVHLLEQSMADLSQSAPDVATEHTLTTLRRLVDSVGGIERELATLVNSLRTTFASVPSSQHPQQRAPLRDRWVTQQTGDYGSATPRLRNRWSPFLSHAPAAPVSSDPSAFHKVLLGWEKQKDAAWGILSRHASWLRGFRREVTAAAETASGQPKQVVVPLGDGREMAITIRGKS